MLSDAVINQSIEGFQRWSSEFDQFSIKVVETKNIAIRIANSAICRENLYRDSIKFFIEGTLEGKSKHAIIDYCHLQQLNQYISDFRSDLRNLTTNKEYVAPQISSGNFSWKFQTECFDEIALIPVIYPLIENSLGCIRSEDLNVSGFVDIRYQNSFVTAKPDFQLNTEGFATNLSFTLNHSKSLASGVARRTILNLDPEDFTNTLNSCLDEAKNICRLGPAQATLNPGNFTVVLSPAALSDIISTTIAYGMFDRRRIEEGRTYLSHAMDTLQFPQSLTLRQAAELPLENGDIFRDLTFNHRFVACDAMQFIRRGKIQDLQNTPYWALKTGKKETFMGHSAPPITLDFTPDQGQHLTTQDLIASTENGLFINDTWYLRMVSEMQGIITGMTRDGLFEIRDGKITRPVRHMRWHNNPFNLLAQINASSQEKQLMGTPRTVGLGRGGLSYLPAVRLDNFHFSSVTNF